MVLALPNWSARRDRLTLPLPQQSPAADVPFSIVETDRCACGGEMAIGTQAPLL